MLSKNNRTRFIGLKWLVWLFTLELIIGQSKYVVEWSPSFPTVDQPITITFYADRGTGGLKGYDGDVYAHTGVITDKSARPSDWKYVKTNWGQNTSATKLTRVTTDQYEFKIENIRSYYGVPSSEKILKLAFVFRSSDSQKEGKAKGGADIFVELYESGTQVVILEPNVSRFNPFMTSVDTTVQVTAIGNSIGSILTAMKILVDGSEVATSTNDTIQYSVALTNPGRKIISTIALDALGRSDTATFNLVYNPKVKDEAAPAGIIDGVNYNSDGTSVTLSLFAPYKSNVYVLGDFNDWQVDTDYFMNRHVVDSDSTRWWLNINGLESRKEYAYQYFVDGELRIADPYSDKILDPWNDHYIPENVYPNLKKYPKEKTQFPVSILQPGQTSYEWETIEFNPPQKEELIIYEILIRDFVANHDYKTLTDSLDYFERLGINAIELMPINEFEGNSSWGYNPSFLFAPDKYYGPKNDLKVFVDSAHARGIAVIMDIVINHSYGQSPFLRLYNDVGFGKPTDQNPWFNREHNFANKDAHWGFDWNHESKATQDVMDRMISYWMNEFKIDGFRFDFTKGIGNNHKGLDDSWGSNYDADRVRLLKRMADKVWSVKSSGIVILEHLAVEKEEKELAEYGMLMWANANHNYGEAVMGYHGGDNSKLSWTYFKNRGWSKPNMVTYMESHDEERIMVKAKSYGNKSGNYDVKKTHVALERMKTAGALFFLIPGPKMIWQFGELGYDISINDGGRLGEKPIKWDYLQDIQRKNLFDTWSYLIGLRKAHPIFNHKNSNLKTWLNGSVKKIQYDYEGKHAFVAGNFDVIPKEVSIELPHKGSWHHVFLGDTISFDSQNVKISVPPGTFILLTDFAVDYPEINMTFLSTKDELIIPEQIRLMPNYPNPFNPFTTIHFSVGQLNGAPIELNIYDVKGRLVESLVNKNLGPGEYRMKWNGVNQPSGVYFVYLYSVEKTQTTKMMLLK